MKIRSKMQRARIEIHHSAGGRMMIPEDLMECKKIDGATYEDQILKSYNFGEVR